MAFVLLIIGAVLVYLGKINVGGISAEGKPVRAAGIVLMLPAAGAFALTFLLALFFMGNPDFLMFMLQIVYILELLAMIAAAGVAYILIANPPNAPKLPGVLGEIQAEQQDTQSTQQPEQSQAGTPEQVRPPQPSAPRPVRARDSYPSIVNTRQAAEYLQMPESRVLAMIESGKLPAARDSGGYRIARIVLDELLEERAST
jgi:excisionase family DNA binding protein